MVPYWIFDKIGEFHYLTEPLTKKFGIRAFGIRALKRVQAPTPSRAFKGDQQMHGGTHRSHCL